MERVQTVLPILAQCLASEIEDVASGEAADNADDVDSEAYVEMMRAPVDLAVKNLQALLDPKKAKNRRLKLVGAEEGDISSLRGLIADMAGTFR